MKMPNLTSFLVSLEQSGNSFSAAKLSGAARLVWDAKEIYKVSTETSRGILGREGSIQNDVQYKTNYKNWGIFKNYFPRLSRNFLDFFPFFDEFETW